MIGDDFEFTASCRDLVLTQDERESIAPPHKVIGRDRFVFAYVEVTTPLLLPLVLLFYKGGDIGVRVLLALIKKTEMHRNE